MAEGEEELKSLLMKVKGESEKVGLKNNIQRHCFAKKGLSSQSYGFSSSHVWMWEMEYKESWAQKNWCFWTGVGEDSLGLQGDQTNQS